MNKFQDAGNYSDDMASVILRVYSMLKIVQEFCIANGDTNREMAHAGNMLECITHEYEKIVDTL